MHCQKLSLGYDFFLLSVILIFHTFLDDNPAICCGLELRTTRVFMEHIVAFGSYNSIV